MDRIADNACMVFFSGTAAQVNAAFRTQMRQFLVHGETHIANTVDPSIPAEFATAIAAVSGLDDLHSAPAHTPAAEFAVGSANYVAPADLSAIYDIAPLYQRGVNGSGAAIAVLARSNVLPDDIADFRNSFGLSSPLPQIIVNGADPGTGSESDFEETELDAEWSGAIAPNASIDIVASRSTSGTDGILLSAEYAVDNNLAPVIAVSYSECEADLGPAESAVYNALWQQAAVQGISVVVAAGDSGAAGCDDPAESVTTHGPAVNGICSSPYSLCVGGTEFTSESPQFWAPENGAFGGSALVYVPEAAWNESGLEPSGSGLWAGGGGFSTIYPRPAWQPGAGAAREVPDVALASAQRNGYLIWQHGAQAATGGTSAAAQVMAGLAALLASGRGERQGNLAPLLYAVAAVRPDAFHDVVTGNNSVPGVAGLAAVSGYDEVTGLGSIDAADLFSSSGNNVHPQVRPCALASPGLFRNCAPSLPVQRPLSMP